MCSGTVIMPNQLSQQISDKSSGVDQMQEGIDDMNKAIYNFGVDERLSGGGYDAARKRLSSYRTYIDGVGYRMKRMVGADGTVSDELSVFGGAEPVSRDEWQSLYDQAGRMKEAYQASAKAHAEAASHAASGGGSDADSGGMVQREEVAAATADRLAGQAEERQAVAKEWLDKIDSYLSATNGVYDQIGEMTDSLDQAAAAFSAAGYDAASMDWGEADMSWVPGLQHACLSVPTGRSIVTEDADGNPVCNEDELEDIYDKPASLLGEDDYNAWRDAMEYVAQKCVALKNDSAQTERYQAYADLFNRMMQMGYKEDGTTYRPIVNPKDTSGNSQVLVTTQYSMKDNFEALLKSYVLDRTNAAYSSNGLDDFGGVGSDNIDRIRAIYAMCGIATGLLQTGQQYTVSVVVDVNSGQHIQTKNSSGIYEDTGISITEYSVPNDFNVEWGCSYGEKQDIRCIRVSFGRYLQVDMHGATVKPTTFWVIDPTQSASISDSVLTAIKLLNELNANGPSLNDDWANTNASSLIGLLVPGPLDSLPIFLGWTAIGMVGIAIENLEAANEANEFLKTIGSLVSAGQQENYGHVVYGGTVVYEDGSTENYMPGFNSDSDRAAYERMMSDYSEHGGGQSIAEWMESTVYVYYKWSPAEHKWVRYEVPEGITVADVYRSTDTSLSSDAPAPPESSDSGGGE